MRLLLIAACLFVTNAFANNYIQVIGTGPTLESAKENAFREAIMIRVGTVVVSERESTIAELKRDDISVYSAGYVKDYKIISVVNNGSVVKVNVNVLVADSKLVNQRLNSGKTTNTINGENAYTNYKTFIDQKIKSDKLIKTVMSSYPNSAYVVEQSPYQIGVDSFRNAILSVHYKLKWNYDYITSFNELMSLVEDSRYGMFERAPSNVIILGKNPKDFVLGEKKHYKFTDVILLDSLKNSMTHGREAKLKLSITDNSLNNLVSQCFNINNTYFSVGEPRSLVLYGNTKEEGVLQLRIPIEYNNILQRASNIQVSVVPFNQC
jgi:hypothetical protein